MIAAATRLARTFTKTSRAKDRAGAAGCGGVVTSSGWRTEARVDRWHYPGPMLAAEAPKITDWMQAWGSLAGLVMSTAAVIFTGLLFRHEIRVRREEQRDNEAALARLVVAQFRYMNTTNADEGGHLTGDITYIDYTILNVASAPILDVSFGLLDVVTGSGKLYRSVERKAVVVKEVEMGVVFDPPLPYDGYGEPNHLVPVVRFTDSNGLRWIRQGTSSPKRDLSGLGAGRGVLLRKAATPTTARIPAGEAPGLGGGQAAG
jgi:hypothetical protein